MSKLIAPVVRLSKQKVITAIVVDVLGQRCSVRLSGNGAVLHALTFIGPSPTVGNTVYVDYSSSRPVVRTGSQSLEDTVDEVASEISILRATQNVIPSPATDPSGQQASEGDQIGWFNVRSYGAIGDGVADDFEAINLAIADFNLAGNGVLYFPGGSYLCSQGLDAITADGMIMGDGINAFDLSQTGSVVNCSSATEVLFSVESKYAKFQNIALVNTAASVTNGSGIKVSSSYVGQRVDYDHVYVEGFYICVDIQVSAQWTMHGCQITARTKYGIKIRNTVNGDAGDWAISNTNINCRDDDADAGIRIESSGGGKIVNCKINSTPSLERFTYGIDISGAGSTSIMLISNCSFENIVTNAIRATGEWNYLIINGCQVGLYTSNNTSAFVLNGMDYFVISNCVLVYNPPSTSSEAAIDITSCTHGFISGIVSRGFTGTLAQASCSDIVNFSSGGMAGDADYTTISDNDADTDVTGEELEELSDGSVTELHSHPGIGSYRQFVWTSDGTDFEFVAVDGEPVLVLQELE